ncbi:hypothetical protein M8J77_010459 [Diaphorina citri]|nr:hypothetical protein M8J77_010459 [Diaphorina citri]
MGSIVSLLTEHSSHEGHKDASVGKLAGYGDCVTDPVEPGGGGGGGALIPRTPQGMTEALPPKRQAVVDRLRRRIENYRRHQSDCVPRYDHSFNGLVERDIQETLLLKQKYLESKAKRSKNKPEKKLPSQLDSGLHNASLPFEKDSLGTQEVESILLAHKGGGGGV